MGRCATTVGFEHRVRMVGVGEATEAPKAIGERFGVRRQPPCAPVDEGGTIGPRRRKLRDDELRIGANQENVFTCRVGASGKRSRSLVVAASALLRALS
jgi:hypothetical protein